MPALSASEWLLLCNTALLAVCLVGLLVLFRRSAFARQNERRLTERIELAEDQLNMLRRELAGLADTVQADSPAVESGETAYSQAIRLALQGMDSSAVAAGCGISRGEAELIVALYRASQRP